MSRPGEEKIRIVLVDDHLIMRGGLCMMIETQPDMVVIGQAGNRAEAFAVVAAGTPDLILLDLDLEGEHSLDFLPELLKAAPGARVLILTGVREPETHHQAVRLGAMGVVLKSKAAETLIKAIRKIQAGEVWLDRSTMANLVTSMSQPKKIAPEAIKIAALTDRERDVITLIGEGLKNEQIAGRMFISEKTVRNHLTSIYDKLGVPGRLELLIYAYRNGLAKLPR